MYQFLRGIITEKSGDNPGSEKLILDVSGIGYEISVSLASLESFGRKGDSVTVYTALIHKEDGMTLYGFPTLLERELFNLLHSVSGIGPKSALNILGVLTVSEICYAILNDDASSLSKAQGVGSKTANRIVLELKTKIENWSMLPTAKGQIKGSNKAENILDNGKHVILKEAREVLESLGYSNGDISDAFSKANGHTKDSESLVHFSLKLLSSARH